MNHIEMYVNGINHDLEKVTAIDGHPLAIDSIKEQARRLGAIAEHNNKYLVDMMNEFYDVLTEKYEVVELGECDSDFHIISKEEFIRVFETYLKWGLDTVNHFDDNKISFEVGDEIKIWFNNGECAIRYVIDVDRYTHNDWLTVIDEEGIMSSMNPAEYPKVENLNHYETASAWHKHLRKLEKMAQSMIKDMEARERGTER